MPAIGCYAVPNFHMRLEPLVRVTGSGSHLAERAGQAPPHHTEVACVGRARKARFDVQLAQCAEPGEQ